jgi:hypothetical protein
MDGIHALMPAEAKLPGSKSPVDATVARLAV